MAGRQIERMYRASAIMVPIQHTGTNDDCREWCSAMLGREVWVTDAAGKQHVVGVISQTVSETADAWLQARGA